MARTTRLARMARMERTSTDFLSRQCHFAKFPCQSVDFFLIGVQTSANLVHATGDQDRTPHRTHHRRTFFSCARYFINAHALAQGSAFSQKSSCRHMFPPHVTPRAASSARYATCCAWSAGCHASTTSSSSARHAWKSLVPELHSGL